MCQKEACACVLEYNRNTLLVSVMSSSGSHTVELCTFSSSEPFALQLPANCTVEKARGEICKKLGLIQTNMWLFGVFLGPKEKPTRLLLETETIPIGAKISLLRWNFNVERESKLVRKDDVAISMLYGEARHNLDRGKIQPTDSQYQELEAFSDPSFPTERQYLELICTIPGYTSYVAEDCKVLEDITCNDASIPSGTVVQCVLDMDTLAFKGDLRKSENLIEWPWVSVRRWKIPSTNEIRFEVCLQRGNAPMMCWVSLATPMAQVIFHTASGICEELKLLQDKAEMSCGPTNPRMAGKHYDPLAEFVDNMLFKKPTFGSF